MTHQFGSLGGVLQQAQPAARGGPVVPQNHSLHAGRAKVDRPKRQARQRSPLLMRNTKL